MHYIKNKREKTSRCNICGCKDKMTWDHVPPKSAIIADDVELLSITNLMTLPRSDAQPFLQSQNGMKFRTICERCNNTLGHQYDKEFSKVILELTRAYTNIGGHPLTASIDAKAFIKSICGHLLSAKLDFEETVPDQKMRDYVLGRCSELNLGVYYWYYPFVENVVLRDIVISRLSTGENAMISVLKCFPISILITDDSMFDVEFERLHHNSQYITLKKQPLYPADYPIRVEDNTMIMGGKSLESALIARPRNTPIK